MSIVRVAITGTLSIPRKRVAELINQTSNGEFVESVTYETHYLVSAITTSKKVRKAADIGTSVIGEAELMRYISEGIFPETRLPERPDHPGGFPEIFWVEKFPGGRLFLLDYVDRNGEISIRTILATATGYTLGSEDQRWIGGYDGPNFKTWRQDRIVNLQEIAFGRPSSPKSS
jgi:hypothetical protein